MLAADRDPGPAPRRHSAPQGRPAQRPALAHGSDAELLAAIGRDLRAVYAEVLRQPLPERLAHIVQTLETSAKRKPNKSA
jgi:anti-sigma factor NepR-like protein